MKAVRRLARSKRNTRTRTRASSAAPRSASKTRSAPLKAEPVGADEFRAALKFLEFDLPLGVAVSGGADSMAALLLTIDWCKQHDVALPHALTVDHGLRAASTAEAVKVGKWARKLGVKHHVHTVAWPDGPPASNIPAAAREMRYAAMGAWARSLGINSVITGHTLNDQAETFLIRLARGSGIDGLSGMEEVSAWPLNEYRELTLVRPLLGFSHARLVATMKAAKHPWIEDPTNNSPRFVRTKLRAAMGVLEQAGLSTERLAETASHLRRARKAIDGAVDDLLAKCADVSDRGYVILSPELLRAAPVEVALRAVARVISAVSGCSYPPPFDILQAASVWLTEGLDPVGRTLHGCRLARRQNGTVLVAREQASIGVEPVSLRPGEEKVWDGRFRVAISASAPEPAIVKALGERGLAVTGPNAYLPPIEPRRIAATTPALWTGGQLVAAPLCKYLSPGGERFGFSATFLGLAKGKGAAKGNSL